MIPYDLIVRLLLQRRPQTYPLEQYVRGALPTGPGRSAQTAPAPYTGVQQLGGQRG